MGHRRKRILLICLAAALAVLAVFALVFWLDKKEPVARIAWSYQPLGRSTTYFWSAYLRPEGGCFAISKGYAANPRQFSTHVSVISAAGQSLGEHSLPAGLNFCFGGAQDIKGRLYVGSDNNAAVYAFDTAGKTLWRCDIPDQSQLQPATKKRRSVPVLGRDGNLHCIVSSGELVIVTLQGVVLTCFNLAQPLNAFVPPALAPNGGCYVVARDNSILRVTATGQVLWSYNTSGIKPRQLESGAQGAVYVSNHKGRCIALDGNGSKLWEYEDPYAMLHPKDFGTISLINDELIVITFGGSLIVLKPDGTQLWSRRLNGYCDRIFNSDDKLYVQVSIETVVSHAERWISSLRYQYTGQFNNPRFEIPQELYVMDVSSGHTLQRVQLPDNTYLLCGPGPQGEFYGSREIGINSYSLPERELVRLELP